MTIFSSSVGSITRAVEWFLVRDRRRVGEIRYGVIDSQRVCYTFEDEDQHTENGNGRTGRAAIPTGRYRITLPVHGRNILVNAVPGFFHVEIRAELGSERDEGDITVGDEQAVDGVGNCHSALTRLITELRRLTMNGTAVWLNVGRAE